jgi:hypothetical protein
MSDIAIDAELREMRHHRQKHAYSAANYAADWTQAKLKECGLVVPPCRYYNNQAAHESDSNVLMRILHGRVAQLPPEQQIVSCFFDEYPDRAKPGKMKTTMKNYTAWESVPAMIENILKTPPNRRHHCAHFRSGQAIHAYLDIDFKLEDSSELVRRLENAPVLTDAPASGVDDTSEDIDYRYLTAAIEAQPRTWDWTELVQQQPAPLPVGTNSAGRQTAAAQPEEIWLDPSKYSGGRERWIARSVLHYWNKAFARTWPEIPRKDRMFHPENTFIFACKRPDKISLHIYDDPQQANTAFETTQQMGIFLVDIVVPLIKAAFVKGERLATFLAWKVEGPGAEGALVRTILDETVMKCAQAFRFPLCRKQSSSSPPFLLLCAPFGQTSSAISPAKMLEAGTIVVRDQRRPAGKALRLTVHSVHDQTDDSVAKAFAAAARSSMTRTSKRARDCDSTLNTETKQLQLINGKVLEIRRSKLSSATAEFRALQEWFTSGRLAASANVPQWKRLKIENIIRNTMTRATRSFSTCPQQPAAEEPPRATLQRRPDLVLFSQLQAQLQMREKGREPGRAASAMLQFLQRGSVPDCTSGGDSNRRRWASKTRQQLQRTTYFIHVSGQGEKHCLNVSPDVRGARNHTIKTIWFVLREGGISQRCWCKNDKATRQERRENGKPCKECESENFCVPAELLEMFFAKRPSNDKPRAGSADSCSSYSDSCSSRDAESDSCSDLESTVLAPGRSKKMRVM